MQVDRQAYNGNKDTILEAISGLTEKHIVRVRKLTPRESLRFMGIDEKTIDKMLKSGCSEDDLYKQAGNSIVVDVLYHIFRKMFIDRDTKEREFEPQPLRF